MEGHNPFAVPDRCTANTKRNVVNETSQQRIKNCI